MRHIEIKKTNDDRIKVAFPYNPPYITKIKTISGYRWHPKEKYWSFPYSDGILDKILKVFEGDKIRLDHALQTGVSSVIARDKVPKQSSKVVARAEHVAIPLEFLPCIKYGVGTSFEDLRRELVSRKYSYKAVKSYIYYNKELINFTCKSPSDINDDDIKDYLFYLAEEKKVDFYQRCKRL